MRTIVAFALALLIPPLLANTLSVVVMFGIVPIMPREFAPIEVLLVPLGFIFSVWVGWAFLKRRISTSLTTAGLLYFPLAIGMLILCMLLIMLLVTGESI